MTSAAEEKTAKPPALAAIGTVLAVVACCLVLPALIGAASLLALGVEAALVGAALAFAVVAVRRRRSGWNRDSSSGPPGSRPPVKSGDRLRIPTVSEVVREATAITDPEGIETAATALYDGFEDDDRPVTAAERLTGELLSTVRAIDPEEDEPAAWAAVAAAVWLASHPGLIDNGGKGDLVLREGVRLVFEGKPPEPLARWLEERGVTV